MEIVNMKIALFGVVLFLAGSRAAFAQTYTNTSDVLDGSGVMSSGGGYTNISATGQPGGISTSVAGTLPLNAGTIVNQAGFLNTFFLRPNLLSVHGIPVEIDPDNDGDGLSDWQEITGSAFVPPTPTDPNDPSTAGDGVSDYNKAIAGTNPLGTNTDFRILAVTNSAGAVFVTWLASGNNSRTYVLRSATNALQAYATVIFSNTVAGGTSPWYAVTNTAADTAGSGPHFYSVTVFDPVFPVAGWWGN
jgi:hypothetical protein